MAFRHGQWLAGLLIPLHAVVAISTCLTTSPAIAESHSVQDRSEEHLREEEWQRHKLEFQRELLPCGQIFGVQPDLQTPYNDDKYVGVIVWPADLSRPRHYRVESAAEKRTVVIRLPPDTMLYARAEVDVPPGVKALWDEYNKNNRESGQLLKESFSLTTEAMMARLRHYIAERLDAIRSPRNGAKALSNQILKACSGVGNPEVAAALQRMIKRLESAERKPLK